MTKAFADPERIHKAKDHLRQVVIGLGRVYSDIRTTEVPDMSASVRARVLSDLQEITRRGTDGCRDLNDLASTISGHGSVMKVATDAINDDHLSWRWKTVGGALKVADWTGLDGLYRVGHGVGTGDWKEVRTGVGHTAMVLVSPAKVLKLARGSRVARFVKYPKVEGFAIRMTRRASTRVMGARVVTVARAASVMQVGALRYRFQTMLMRTGADRFIQRQVPRLGRIVQVGLLRNGRASMSAAHLSLRRAANRLAEHLPGPLASRLEKAAARLTVDPVASAAVRLRGYAFTTARLEGATLTRAELRALETSVGRAEGYYLPELNQFVRHVELPPGMAKGLRIDGRPTRWITVRTTVDGQLVNIRGGTILRSTDPMRQHVEVVITHARDVAGTRIVQGVKGTLQHHVTAPIVHFAQSHLPSVDQPDDDPLAPVHRLDPQIAFLQDIYSNVWSDNPGRLDLR